MDPLRIGGAVPPRMHDRRFGTVRIRRVSVSPFDKPGRPLVQPDDVFWTSVLAGSLTVEGRGAKVLLTKEVSTIRRGLGASRSRTAAGADILSLAVPRDRLQDRGLKTEYLLLPVDPLARAAQKYLLTLLRRRFDPHSPANASLGAAAEEMLVAMLMEQEGYRADSAAAFGGLRLRAEALIQALCTEPELGPQAVADALGVSLRSLQRAYAEAGTTVSARIDGHRRARAERLIAAPVRMGFDEVAAKSGFRSTYQLRRVIQQAHGMSLKDFRQQLSRPGTLAPPV
ncbi:helix-turn-helix transcriptional regulator [Arthrobacter koreensis]|uniref:helix-turn-helix transcriptional regulator n=1 Tax=Arthrobacter koreensis TaxID=199136 RepID=UPI002DB81788|nr:helix-turn-helix domain-containing protein [Arthrobacter koreensis]MEB7503997.1 helix-turn-helix domain-containing protein [Arthrobacter koreensis]